MSEKPVDNSQVEIPPSPRPPRPRREAKRFDSPDEARNALGESTAWRWDIVKFDDQRRTRRCSPIYSFDFDQDIVAAKHGAGEYRRSLRATNRGISDELYGEDFPISEEEAAEAKQRLTPSAPIAAAPHQDLVAQLSLIMDAKLAQIRAEMALRPAAVGGSSDMIEMLKAIVPTLRPPDNGFGTKELFALLIPILTQKATPTPATEIAEYLKLAKDLQGGGGDGGGSSDIAAFAPVLQEFLKLQANQPRPVMFAPPQLQLQPAPQLAPGGSPPAPPAPPSAPAPREPGKRQPFPGAAAIVEAFNQYGPMLRAQELTAEIIEQLVAGLEDAIEHAGGDVDDVIDRYTEPSEMVGALIGYAPQLAADVAPLTQIAAKFLEEAPEEIDQVEAPKDGGKSATEGKANEGSKGAARPRGVRGNPKPAA